MRKSFGLKAFIGDSGPGKDLLLKKDAPFTTVWPFWSMDPSAPIVNVFRFLPVKCEEDGEEFLSPFRYSPEPRDFGGWLFAAYLANIGGKKGISFLIGNLLTHSDYEIERTPYFVLYENVRRILSSGSYPHWVDYNLIKFGAGRGGTQRLTWDGASETSAGAPLLSKPEVAYFSVSLIAHHPFYPYCGKFYGVESNERLFVTVMKRTIGDKLIELLDSNPAMPSIIDFNSGSFVHITRARDPNVFMYDVSIINKFENLNPSLSGQESKILSRLKQWKDILHFPTIEEQIKYICQSAIPAEVIYRCLNAEFGRYLPADIIERAREQINYLRGVSSRVTTEVFPKQTEQEQKPANPATEQAVSQVDVCSEPIPVDICQALNLTPNFTYSNDVMPKSSSEIQQEGLTDDGTRKKYKLILSYCESQVVKYYDEIPLPSVVSREGKEYFFSMNWEKDRSRYYVGAVVIEEPDKEIDYYAFWYSIPSNHQEVSIKSGVSENCIHGWKRIWSYHPEGGHFGDGQEFVSEIDEDCFYGIYQCVNCYAYRCVQYHCPSGTTLFLAYSKEKKKFW